jgi:hypothetical protein
MIRFTCPQCGKSLAVKESLAGKKGPCPQCGTGVAAPAVPSRMDARTLPPRTQPGKAAPASLGKGNAHRPSDTGPGAGEDKELYDFLAPAQQADELGRLGGYRVLKVLGAGGMGVVFQAEDPALKRRVAIKAILPGLAVSEAARKRFLREARTVAAAEHDHIVHIYQVGEDRGALFIVMPLLKGEPLDARLERVGAVPVTEVIRIGREAALGLAAAHEKGLIHRDIKPANLWLEANTGRVKILDFGLAREAQGGTQLTPSGVIVGTPAYMAPEQAGGRPVDARCDLFSLGCVLYQAATGTPPFKGADMVSTLLAVMATDPKAPHELRPDIPEPLSRLIMALLAKDPAGRPASAETVAEILTDLQKGQEAAARRRWLLPAVIGGGLLAVGILAVFLSWPGGGKRTGPPITKRVGGDGARKEKDNGPGGDDAAGKDKTQAGKEEAAADDRAVAEWAVSEKADLWVQPKSGGPLVSVRVIQKGFPLPKEPFHLNTVGFGPWCKINEDDLARFRGLPHLAKVELDGQIITGAGLAHLRRLSGLTQLYLVRTRVGGEGLSCLEKFPVLDDLVIIGTKLEAADLAHLQKVPKLRLVNLENTSLTNDALAPLAEMPRLSWLTLDQNPISDAGLAHLEKLTKLERLQLKKTGITDDGLRHLKGLTRLKYLAVGDTEVTARGVAALKESLPGLEIER